MTQQRQERRLDIQGLRAVASLLVASYHIWFGNVSGGVDVFFAVGGYLLAMSLLREIEKTGQVNVPMAIWRNMQRLFPMAFLVLLVAGTISVIAAGPLGYDRVLTDIFASATYWENWRLAADATDYVAAGHDKSAFQHFWAMGAQGQFTWACVALAGLFVLLTRRLRDKARALGWLLLAISVASFVYANVRLAVDPVPTYYDTFARTWELGLGACAALLLARLPLPRIARALMGIVGLALILTAGLLPQEWLQPGWVTLYPVAGALLVLLAGEGEADAGPVSKLLRIQPLVWIGGISYGLYLWHWPVLKGFIALFPAGGREINVFEGTAILGCSMLLSWASYRLIALVHGRSGATRRPPVLAYLLPAVAVVAAIGLAVAPAVQRRAIDGLMQAGAAFELESGAALQAAVSEAARQPGAPAAGAVVGEDARGAEWIVDECLTVDPDDVARCYFDDSSSDNEVWVVGDSQAVTWAPALRRALDGAADLQLLGRSMCPFSTGEVVAIQGGGTTQFCDAQAAMVLDLAAERLPELVVITYGAWWTGIGYEDRPVNTGTLLAEGTMPWVEQLHELGIRTLWLDSPPPANDPAVCLDAHVAGGDTAVCASPLQQAHVDRHNEMLETFAAGGVEVADTLPWFCDLETAVCPIVVLGVPTWVDATHMGAAASAMRTPAVAEVILPLLERAQDER